MNKAGIAYVIVGIVAIIGAVIAALFMITMVSALSIINSADASQLPPGTDLSALQESMGYFNMLILLGSVWILSVILSGLLCVHTGIRQLRKVKIKTMSR